jgi:hypothetical protein
MRRYHGPTESASRLHWNLNLCAPRHCAIRKRHLYKIHAATGGIGCLDQGMQDEIYSGERMATHLSCNNGPVSSKTLDMRELILQLLLGIGDCELELLLCGSNLAIKLCLQICDLHLGGSADLRFCCSNLCLDVS